MDWESILAPRPIVVAIAGSNGAGKSTFYHAHFADAGLRFVNADDIAAELDLGAYEAANTTNVPFMPEKVRANRKVPFNGLM